MAEGIGFIGLGDMGEPIARRLVEAGHDVSVYNRTAERTKNLAAAGATVAATHGGEVRVWSAEGQGSTFTLTLPQHFGAERKTQEDSP